MSAYFNAAIMLFVFFAGTTHAQVYRCGNSYSASPCAGGREVDVSNPLSDPAGPKSVQIYLCKTPSSKLFWIQERCANRGWSLERSEWVPKNLSWDDQLDYARGKRSQAQALMNPVPVARSSAAPTESKVSQCKALEERVNWLDSLGRAGGSGYTMDWIREQRKLARDQQFRLRC